MAEKVTIMKLKVDLEYEKCYKKVKKLLCKFPQIRDQVYDKKNNIVTITVVCCNPEKIRDKLCCKGCGTIKSIEIVEPTKPPPPPPPPHPIVMCCVLCYVGRPGWPCFHGCGGPPPCYEGYYGRPRPVCYCYGGGRPCRCDEYFCEENTAGCTVM